MDKPFFKCRLCLKLGDFCSVFEQDESIKLSDMVMSFANIEIYEGDGLPDRVCSSCIENLSTAYIFKLQVERIDHLLRKSSDIQANPHTAPDFDMLLNKDFHVHTDYGSIEENGENCVKDGNVSGEYHSASDKVLETSDDTDSDVDSIKCVHCNEAYNHYGAHKCHVTCTIEHDQHQYSSSTETLVATDAETTPDSPTQLNTSIYKTPPPPTVSCVLCDEKLTDYDLYVTHLNKCTANVKLHHFVCPACHEIFTDKYAYFQHLRMNHFLSTPDSSFDCVDSVPLVEKTRVPKPVRRQIGWSVEDIYQEIECKKVEDTPTSSPFKSFFSKLGNESFSRQSTPKRVSFRKLIEDGKQKTSNYFHFKKHVQNVKKVTHSPLKGKLQVTSKIKASLPEIVSDSDYTSPSGTSEESWKMKQNLICACDKKVFMISEFVHDRDRLTVMIKELGGVIAENTKMEMLATHFISVLPNDTYTGMMVCALATGKWLLHVNFVYDSFRAKRFMRENLYEWKKHPKVLELDNTSVEVAKAAVYWHLELNSLNAKFPFEGKQIVLIMKKKYRQYYQMIFKTLKAKPLTYDPRTPGSCCTADYCFVDMKVIERVKLRFFARHDVPVFPYQYILVYLLNRGRVDDEQKYVLQELKKHGFTGAIDCLNKTF
ncbi:unnamed protein product [Plutella xylostella]|uniref:(diamondback moth) hypothetical protein n=1 Tax=Plutella xylostella TaxID=51655 RepID=A0A8S4E247_PLUXY|nr:unnamed protein product [Plutella xylostella]